ncbi:hypothetical protein BY458DRAFT_461963 [Sporodiniella umbellata]|nr:hypothetical protein BY458DRAFT_461963 [Sporodiniella umbellata]
MHSYSMGHPTKRTIKPPPMKFDFESTKHLNDPSRFPVPTPPLSSESPTVELAPMTFEWSDRIIHDHTRPPSPESPNLKRFLPQPVLYQERPNPLEPWPQFDETKVLFPLSLYQPLKTPHAFLIPHIQIPIPRRRSLYREESHLFSLHAPMSPIMAAASASAASVHYSKGEENPFDSSSSCASHSPPASHLIYRSKPTVDQSMFLTKNAHIKRPRNAWIHFRCHYGQALKIQDPTLRAEEISKRASRRWSKLSENEKKPWHALAEQEKLAHREAFPEYRYCPRRATPATTTPLPKRPLKDLAHDPLLYPNKKPKRKLTK